MLIRIISLTILLGSSLLGFRIAVAQTDASRASINELLTTGWDTKPAARKAADDLYREYVEQNPGDRQALYAMALVKMQQGRYPDAAELVDQYLAGGKTDLAAWRAKSWLSMLLKNHTASLSELDKLSQLLEQDAAEDLKDEDELRAREQRQQELIRYLGRMIGYLEGPADGAVTEAALAAAHRKIAARLDGTHKPLLDEGRASVTDAFAVFATAKDDAKTEEIEVAEKIKRQTLANLEQEAIDIASRREQLIASSNKIQEEARAEQDTYNKADAPLVSQLTQLNAQAAVIDRDLANVTGDLFALRRQLDRERNPIIRDQILRDIGAVEITAARISRSLATAEAAASAVQAQRVSLANRYQQSQAGFRSALLRLDKEAKGLDSKLKRADAERAQLKKPATGNTGKVISMSKQALGLTTYEAFPLEQERRRLMEAK